MNEIQEQKVKKTMLDAELRDLFAGFALIGLLPEKSFDDLREDKQTREKMAFLSYEMADEMIKRRKINKAQVNRDYATRNEDTQPEKNELPKVPGVWAPARG